MYLLYTVVVAHYSMRLFVIFLDVTFLNEFDLMMNIVLKDLW